MKGSKHGLRDFDAAECLMSEDAIVEYLRLSFEEDDLEGFAEALADAARARARLSNGANDAPSVVDGFRSLGFSLTPIPTPARA